MMRLFILVLMITICGTALGQAPSSAGVLASQKISAAAGIAWDATTTASDSAGSSPMTWSHTCTGSNLFLVVGFVGVARSATAVTYNGVAMTQIGTNAATLGGFTAQLWGLINPATGSNTVSATTTGVPGLSMAGFSSSYTGVHQTTPTGTAAQATGEAGSGSPTVNVSSASGELVVDCVINQDPGTFTVGAGQTQRANLAVGSNPAKCAGSEEAGGATVTMSWTQGNSNAWAINAVPLKPA